jgi:indole-3-pyruvate monooxygenase
MSDVATSAPLPVVIVGAGPAGLACAACLKRRGVEALVLEAGSTVGGAWRRHYDRLHLHTVKEESHLPGMPFPAEVPRYPARADVVAYLEAYAATFALAPRFDEAVRRVGAREGGGYVVQSARAVYEARAVVVAAGYNRVPNPERLPGQELFGGALLHAAEYRSGEAFAGQRVLVVGAGNTGAELALDLVERNARSTLAIRSPVNVMPRDFLGLPTQVTGIKLRNAPVKVADRLGRIISRLAFGDLARFGFARPELGPISAIRLRRRIPLIDNGTIAAVKRGQIAVKPGVERFTKTGAVFRDGSEGDFDVVILATGYRPALAELVDVPGAVNEEGTPRAWLGGVPGLFFVGYENVATGLLREIALQAEAVADALVATSS